jgi:hypothetical protein
MDFNSLAPSSAAACRASKVVVSLFATTISALLAGCGSPAKPAELPQATVETAASAPTARKAPQVMQELGSIEPREVAAAFRTVEGDLLECQKRGARRVEYLAGDVKFFIRINHEGQAKYVLLEESTLGDLETESCMRAAVMKGHWPKPVAGEDAEARQGFGFDVLDAREPTAWGPDKVVGPLAAQDKAIKACLTGTTASFKVTLYVVPNGTDGRVEAAGVATASRDGAAKSECVHDAVMKLRFPSPGSYAAKLSFSL